jgi:hypothetical protein
MYNGFRHSNKESLIEPVVIYIVCCAAKGVQFSRIKVLVLGTVVLGFLFYVYPLVQSYHATDESDVGLTTSEIVDKITNSRELIANFKEARLASIRENTVGEYFGGNVGLFERYALIGLDAELINSTQSGDYMGYDGVIQGAIDWIPHFLYPNKPVTFSSEDYMHRLPGVNTEDTTTGVSFGSFGSAYAMGGWTGLVLLITFVEGAFFLIMDTLCPRVSNTPWMVCLLAFMLHAGPEANIDVLVTALVLVPVEVTFAILMARYGVRAFSSIVGGSQRGAQLEEFRQKRARELAARASAAQ